MQNGSTSSRCTSASTKSGKQDHQAVSMPQCSSRLRQDGSKGFMKRPPKLSKDGGSARASLHAKRLLSGKIGKRSFSGYLGRTSKTPHHSKLGHRPKRNAIHRAWDYTAGLSWKEEKELKKAIYASLQESKKPNRTADGSHPDTDHSPQCIQSKVHPANRKGLTLKMPDPNMPQPSCSGGTGKCSQGQVRAQRKFAQGSRPGSPGCSPAKNKCGGSKVLATKKAKTEDFLTFLCLRGSSSLPPHLDFMNNTLECESLQSFPNTPRHSQDGSRPNTPGTPTNHQGARSSRADSPETEITPDTNDLGVRPLPLDTPENTPVKQSHMDNPSTINTVCVEADTTVLDDNSPAQDSTQGVVVINSSPEKSGDVSGESRKEKSLSKRKASIDRVKKAIGRTPGASKRKSDVNDSGRNPDSQTSEKLGKKIKLGDKKWDKLRPGTRSQGQKSDVDTIDLTTSEGRSNPRNNPKSGRSSGRRQAPSPDIDTDNCEDISFTESPHKKLKSRSRTDSKSGSNIEDPIVSSDKSKLKRSKQSVSQLPEEGVDGAVARRGQLRSSVAASPRPSGSGSPAIGKTGHTPKRDEPPSKSMPRTRTGAVPKAAVRPGFPRSDEAPRLAEVPTYHPSAEQFQDPITYIETIRPDAESYGMCRIVPPDGWRPECNISEDLRFTTQVQYIHKMADRWGPNVKQMECVKQHLRAQGINMEQAPCVGGVELDLPSLSEAIETLGGLQHVINKNKWLKVADQMKVPKSFQERTSRLYEIYCKYLLSYDTLGEEEKCRLEQEVENKHLKGSKSLDQTCASKGRSRPLAEFFRVARNTQSMWFSDEAEPSTEEVEEQYWQLVSDREQHVMVQVAHIDTKHCGSAFPFKKDGPYSRHGWNYNLLQNHPKTLLPHLGQVTGLTVPMLHIGMVLSTSCWARDPHFLPYIVYSHTGADVIWYCVPSSEETKFKEALEKLAPRLIDPQSSIWLPEDSVMVEPSQLIDAGVSLCRTVQRQGDFVVVFPKAFTATVTCGYNISESLHFATPTWLSLGEEAAELLYESGEPDLFSMDRLLVLLATADIVQEDTLTILLPQLEKAIERELDLRKRLGQGGLQQAKKVKKLEQLPALKGRRRSVDLASDDEVRCEVSSKICFFSMVANETDNRMFCLPEALKHIRKKKNLRNCKLLYVYDQKELRDIVQQVRHRISTGRNPSRKKSSSKNR